MNTTIRPRMTLSCLSSSISLTTVPLMKSSVSVEEDVSTSEESVDMEAESTRMTTTEIRKGERPESMVGMIASNPWETTSTWSANRRPNPPRK